MSDTWQVEPHPVIPELDEHYAANAYQEPVQWATVADKLDHATMTQLRALMNGGLGDVRP